MANENKKKAKAPNEALGRKKMEINTYKITKHKKYPNKLLEIFMSYMKRD